MSVKHRSRRGFSTELFAMWCEEKNRSDDLSHVAVKRGKCHDYLGMALDHSRKKALLIDVTDNASQIEKHFQDELEKNNQGSE